jgi:hypothetical protein
MFILFPASIYNYSICINVGEKTKLSIMEEVMIKHYGRKYKKKEKYQDKAKSRMGRHVERRKKAMQKMDLEDSELSVENIVLMEENEEGKQVPTVIINKEADVVTLTRTSLDKPREGTSRSQSRRNSIDMIRRNSLDAPSRVSIEGSRRSSIDNGTNRRRSIEIGPNKRNSLDGPAGTGGRSRANSISERPRPVPPTVVVVEEHHSDHEAAPGGGGIMFASAENYTTGQYYDVEHQHLHYHHHHHHYHFPRQPHGHGHGHRHKRHHQTEGEETNDPGKQKKDKKSKKKNSK